jgi:hypothetical protein
MVKIEAGYLISTQDGRLIREVVAVNNGVVSYTLARKPSGGSSNRVLTMPMPVLALWIKNHELRVIDLNGCILGE